MKWILTLESFLSRLPKRYFVKYSDDMNDLSRMGTTLNFKIRIYRYCLICIFPVNNFDY